MGCCTSSPYSKRRYKDPADLDEDFVPIRYFGTNRVGSNLVPDDIDGIPSTHIEEHLAANRNLVLYEAEIDQGKGFRCLRPAILCSLTPCGIAYLAGTKLLSLLSLFTCDESCCWVRKEYNARNFLRVYSNRIEFNRPLIRCPYGWLGCGSWSADYITVNQFDRGAFGFQRVNSTVQYLCCIWPIYGGVVARHRCQCNGPLWNRMFTDCGGWWCDEWICQMMFCSFHYTNLADADETAFAASIALQAYFEGRALTPDQMKKCVEFWREHISEQTDPVGRKRSVCCEPYAAVPCPTCEWCYEYTHPKRNIPYHGEEVTENLVEAYEKYEKLRLRQIKAYKSFHGPVRHSSVCRAFGCRRFFGRKGFCFCTEGCCSRTGRKAGDPASPFFEHDFDDEWDASSVLIKVLGPPPPNVVIKRWRWDPERNENYLCYLPEMKSDSTK